MLFLKNRFSQYSSRIDILVLYTSQMQIKYGAAISGLIQHFVDLTNTTFQNSGITTQLRLVYTQQYNHTDTIEGADIYELTFAHELGHNLGCAHDRDHANTGGAYYYSYGYDILNTFATVMSYDWPEIMYFSTPLVSYKVIKAIL